MFGLGKKVEPVDARAMLGDVIADLADAVLAQQALHLFDHPEKYLEWEGLSSGDPPWIEEEREPEPGEVASDILFNILLHDERIAFIDWATGGEGILDRFDRMLVKMGEPPIDAASRTDLLALAEDAERGDAMMKLWTPLTKEIEARGLYLGWWSTGQDAHFPLVMRSAAHKRWSRAKFGKNFPVLP